MRKYLGNKKKEGNLTDKEKEYYIDNKVCKVCSVSVLVISTMESLATWTHLKAAVPLIEITGNIKWRSYLIRFRSLMVYS